MATKKTKDVTLEEVTITEEVITPSVEATEKENAASVKEAKETNETNYQPKLDNLGRAYATGKRKNAIARVWIKPGKGKITINHRELKVYFARPILQMLINQPFEVSNNLNNFDVFATVVGGGLSGQAGAVKHGISKALVNYNPELRKTLKPFGFLTRDSRVVERKKYGRAKARKSFQFSKR